MNIAQILEQSIKMNASDIHLTVGLPPKVRCAGRLVSLELELLTDELLRDIAHSMMNETHLAQLDEIGEVDFSYCFEDTRYRVNAFKKMGSYTMAMRMIKSEIPNPQEIGIPPTVLNLYRRQRGLVLITGPTGNGKTTTLATIIDLINKNREAHIITMEEPIEFVHKHNKSIVNQREIGEDSKSYASALKAALREDPDVILIGEMRDYETISIAITAAETGHLVFSTLHTMGVAGAIDRIVDVFPPYQQQQVRVQLAGVLEAVIYQQLVPSLTWNHRVPAFEIMLKNHATSNLIREGKTFMLNSVIQTNRKEGMVLMDDYLKKLALEGKITKEIEKAYSFSSKLQ